MDTVAVVTCFDLLRQYDAIDWNRTGSLRFEIQIQLPRVQGVGTSGVAGNIHFCEDGKNVLAMSTIVKLGFCNIVSPMHQRIMSQRYPHSRTRRSS